MECYDHGLVPDRKCKVCRVVAAQGRRDKAAPENPYLDPDYVNRVRDDSSSTVWRREILGQWVDAGGGD